MDSDAKTDGHCFTTDYKVMGLEMLLHHFGLVCSNSHCLESKIGVGISFKEHELTFSMFDLAFFQQFAHPDFRLHETWLSVELQERRMSCRVLSLNKVRQDLKFGLRLLFN